MYLCEGTRKAEMLAFPFVAARRQTKLAERVSSGLTSAAGYLDLVFLYAVSAV